MSILVVARRAIPPAWLPGEGAVALPWEVLAAWLERAPWAWRPREAVEEDPAWKQPIPYVLLQAPDGRLAAYPRRGSEARLHGLWSVGLGGHVERADGGTPLSAIRACARRELREEAGLALAPSFLGCINEERTAVGAVHWGLVFVAQADPAWLRAGEELAGLCWVHPEDARALGLERWSLLALSLLEKS